MVSSVNGKNPVVFNTNITGGTSVNKADTLHSTPLFDYGNKPATTSFSGTDVTAKRVEAGIQGFENDYLDIINQEFGWFKG